MNCINYDHDPEGKLLLFQKQNPSSENEHQETKVKSISKNWELIASSNLNKNESQALSSNSISKLKTSNSFCYESNLIRSRPKEIVEKIEKFNSNNNVTLNQYQQKIKISKTLLQQQYSSSSSLTSPSQLNAQKTRLNSGGTNSDDCDGSKDDGFETQSNASSSQNSDNNLKSNERVVTDPSSVIQQCNNLQPIENFNGFLVTITSPKQILSKNFLTKKLDLSVSNSELLGHKNMSCEENRNEIRRSMEDFVLQSESKLNITKSKNSFIEETKQNLPVSFYSYFIFQFWIKYPYPKM